MKATETQLLPFLEGKKQFVIPIYQRTYSWTLGQCRQLWSDILRAAQDDSVSGHFVGSIVSIQEGIYQAGGHATLLVIDGQQRLTTLSLLLAALSTVVRDSEEEYAFGEEEIREGYLLNKYGKGEQRYKLLLTRSDREALQSLVDSTERPENASGRVMENYGFFVDQIRKSGVSPDELYAGIGKLLIVDISLDRNYDNPQLIFESLNSTGLDLSQADLIRNYILMGLEPERQERVYNNYWFRMETSFGHDQNSGYFDRFMRDYLTLKSASGQIPKIDEVYKGFKSYSNTQEASIEDIVADVYRFSRHFVKLAFLREDDREIREILADINRLRVDVAYPLLLRVYDDYSEGKLSRGDFISVLKLVEGYVFRRLICGIPTNSLNKTFATLGREIDEEDYLASVEVAFLLKDSYRRFPKDEEFRFEFIRRDVYNLRNRNYLLEKLENHRRKERVRLDDYTIEHVMPQNENLSEAWKVELGEEWERVHTDYLHTIGNLTLTGYNPELSDRPFSEKRDMDGGFRDSPIRLNRSLAKVERWDEDAIRERGETLADVALGIWKSPKMTREELDTYRSRTPEEHGYTLEHYSQYLQGDMMELFQSLRRRILYLDPSVREEIKKWYIAYKTTTNFVDVVPKKSRLLLYLNTDFEEIDDPVGICRDVTTIGTWGNGNVELGLTSQDELDDAMGLILQSFDLHREDAHERAS